MKKIYKYATGQEVPEGAIYLYSIKNGLIEEPTSGFTKKPKEYYYVWHYFLVEIEE